MLSVDAVQERLIWVLLAGVAVRFVGTVGGVVSEVACVVALAVPEYPLKFVPSVARTR